MKERHTLSVGIIENVGGGGKGSAGTITIYYSFFVDRVYEESDWTKEFSQNTIRNQLLGKRFPVLYNDNWNGVHSVILITPRNFEYYGYSFPDSLKWVLPYIEKD